MANYIEYSDLAPQRFVAISSRYINSKIVYYTDRKILTFNTYKKGEYVPQKNDKFMVITKGMEYRPDLVSQQAYGIPDFWWKVLEANSMKDILEFKAGETIRIPNVLF